MTKLESRAELVKGNPYVLAKRDKARLVKSDDGAGTYEVDETKRIHIKIGKGSKDYEGTIAVERQTDRGWVGILGVSGGSSDLDYYPLRRETIRIVAKNHAKGTVDIDVLVIECKDE